MNEEKSNHTRIVMWYLTILDDNLSGHPIIVPLLTLIAREEKCSNWAQLLASIRLTDTCLAIHMHKLKMSKSCDVFGITIQPKYVAAVVVV